MGPSISQRALRSSNKVNEGAGSSEQENIPPIGGNDRGKRPIEAANTPPPSTSQGVRRRAEQLHMEAQQEQQRREAYVLRHPPMIQDEETVQKVEPHLLCANNCSPALRTVCACPVTVAAANRSMAQQATQVPVHSTATCLTACSAWRALLDVALGEHAYLSNRRVYAVNVSSASFACMSGQA